MIMKTLITAISKITKLHEAPTQRHRLTLPNGNNVTFEICNISIVGDELTAKDITIYGRVVND
jgi:hypothetical protein